MDFVAYVLENFEGRRYTGSSSNMESRLAMVV
jgi:predicted GIY-YIG superfamily endonuclease